MITLHPTQMLDRAISYGESCFETIAAINGAIFDWSQHQQRLQLGCSQLGIALDDHDLAQISTALHRCITDDSRIIRITVTPGNAEMGIIALGKHPQAYIQYQTRVQRPPVSLISMQHPHGNRIIQAKFSSDYSIMLRLGGRAILQQGATPMLWDRDRICCAATANIALHCDGVWCTPDSKDGGLLPGVIRHHLLARGLLHSQHCDRHLLARCDAIALLNSGGLIQAVTSVDGIPYGNQGAINTLRAALEKIIEQAISCRAG
ncbi:MAG: aminotransferase class IV [Mariprofundales bacterium]